jgi:predicted ABC-type ATPase
LHDTVGIDAFVNADVIAEGLAAFRPESAALEAGRIMLRRLAELGRARADLAFESTLAGRSAFRVLNGLVYTGYDIHIFYLWLPSPELAVARVRRRVALGGHGVPEIVVRRRFQRSLINFYHLYRPLATTWRVYDGSVPGGHPLIAHGEESALPVVIDEPKWVEILEHVEVS